MSHELRPPTHAFAACGLRPPALGRRHGVLHSSRDATCRRLAERHGLRGKRGQVDSASLPRRYGRMRVADPARSRSSER